jgi:hypothetical protein
MVVGGGLKESGTDGTRETAWFVLVSGTDVTIDTAWFVLVSEWW